MPPPAQSSARTAPTLPAGGGEGAPLRRPSHPIVVNAPSFDETQGGAIVLHRLAHLLRELGHEAYLHPLPRRIEPPAWSRLALRERWRVWRVNRWRRRQALAEFRTHPALDVPRAPRAVLRRAIVVYPEIVDGNPLRARRVARWLLHRPGFFNPNARFGKAEITFFFQDAFREGLDWVDPDNLLRVRWIRDDVYGDQGLPRAGACRMLRKGKRAGHAPVPEGDDALPVDGLSHEETAAIFARTERFLCHDPYTMYLFYAAFSGCIPVVVPPPGMSREDWQARPENRWGVAWGESEEEIAWAVATRRKLIARVLGEREEAERSVRRFLAKLADRFG